MYSSIRVALSKPKLNSKQLISTLSEAAPDICSWGCGVDLSIEAERYRSRRLQTATLWGSGSVVLWSESGSKWELGRTGSVTVVLPLSALLSSLTSAGGGPPLCRVCVFHPPLCCDTEQDRLVRRVGYGVLKGLRVTSRPHQTVRDKYRRLLSDRDTEPAACLSAAAGL